MLDFYVSSIEKGVLCGRENLKQKKWMDEILKV
jgi:hypothetical protein